MRFVFKKVCLSVRHFDHIELILALGDGDANDLAALALGDYIAISWYGYDDLPTKSSFELWAFLI